MRTMAQSAGLKGKFTNHSVRKTSCTNLLQAGVPPTLIQQISGHKNVSSLSNYATASREQVCEMNRILANPKSMKSRTTSAVSLPVQPAATISYPEKVSFPENHREVTDNVSEAAVTPKMANIENSAPEPCTAAPVSNATLMLNTNSSSSGFFHSATFHNCTFHITLGNKSDA